MLLVKLVIFLDETSVTKLAIALTKTSSTGGFPSESAYHATANLRRMINVGGHNRLCSHEFNTTKILSPENNNPIVLFIPAALIEELLFYKSRSGATCAVLPI
jgi:hypothetical protein